VVTALAICVGLASLVISFFSPAWAWGPLAVSAGVLLLTLFGAYQHTWPHIDELSPQANEILQRFGPHYSMPFAGRDFSAATSTIRLSAAAVGIVNLFYGFWWGLLLAPAFWFGLAPAANAFNPTEFIRGTPLEAAHDEVIEWIRRRSQARRPGGV
jgi:hypothetical protein